MPLLVLEKRKFPRVNLTLSGILTYREGMYCARLDNISLAGALVSLREYDCPPMSRGERCSLALYRSGSSGTLQFTTRVVHFGYDMATVRFVNLDVSIRLMLRSLIAHQIPERNSTAPRISHCLG
jgi:hypothetical protein